jgi:hypothetical protein
MKYALLLVPILTSAALGATRETRWDVRRLWPAEAALAPLPQIDPPWLTASAELLAADLHAGQSGQSQDPHAGLYAGANPHAHGDPHDPHAGLSTEANPHAHGDLHDPHAAQDPHAHGDLHDPHAAQDPHAGRDPHDPHAAPHATAPTHPTHYADESDPHLPARYAASVNPVMPLPRSTAKNAHTVAEIFSQRLALSETTIRLHATVVKLTEGILGKTYLHLQDGSGSPSGGNGDLTATTTESFVLGESVEVEGRLAIDQDVGLGYRYEALLTQTARVASP